MAVSKAETEKKPPLKKKRAPRKKKAPVFKGKKYRATKRNMYHPFQRVKIPTAPPGIILEEDSWIDCQIEAGLLKEV